MCNNVYQYIAGVDEAGRGPLAGPVIAAAVILDTNYSLEELKDSKKLTPHRRQCQAVKIRESAVAWAIGEATVAEIDAFNILQATLLAMRRAIYNLHPTPQYVVVDGKHCPPDLPCPAQWIVRGDQTVACISAASIIAKTHRDALMVELDCYYPEYGFKHHKGYGTRQHLEALMRYGASPVHRRSFAPVKRAFT